MNSANNIVVNNNKKERLQTALNQDRVDMKTVGQIAFNGMCDDNVIRATCWKLLLGYLPKQRGEWKKQLDKTRQQYKEYCEDLLVEPNNSKQSRQDSTNSDHPLNLEDDSRWKEYFKDEEILEQIQRDVVRTHPDIVFFSGHSKEAVIHREEMQRALLIHAKLNPALSYVQGMNEIYAPLYYVFKQDVQEAEFAEADAFFCFIDILGDFRDCFLTSMDRDSSSGSGATINRIIEQLKIIDLELWEHLENKTKINHHYYAFRWTTLLLTQEFIFPDVIRLWDTIFSDPRGRMDCLIRICLAMLVNVRQELLQGDFSSNVKLLQSYPRDVDVQIILKKADEIHLLRQVTTW